MTHELLDILNKVKRKFTDDSDLTWTIYKTAKEVRLELEQYIRQLTEGDNRCLEIIGFHFAPTGTFQEHSLQNNWITEFMELGVVDN